jgi:hypothetical protein
MLCPRSMPSTEPAATKSGHTQDEATKAQSVSGLPMVRRPVPRLTLPHHVLGSWLFAAALAQVQQLKHDAELIAASTLLHDIGLTAAFTGEVGTV